ncbi:hypothetical protein SAMN05443287_113105 [Micromonospora phaseoli]|uniref:Uncharacterized protein n=1 Tax=Micromonospora phaseoli TaxID=1144548 RepID=A0A1H7DEL5_9ACTN|nr:hypothetical protein [Micromonospora phaseoli]PZV90494.1 hypothetical protein CLV64_11331 [Micromonospora phaseoli]GIJ78114.1 hypothetical protein Xph01_25460 [Micromonospora phaseoli]SEK00128.1 hypothetical protein SAMN05443287_113105 [Micromonospora phaseoli]
MRVLNKSANRSPDGSIVPGELFLLTRAASPQFVRPITIRVIRHRTDRTTYDGWTWIECYQLDARGDAVERRELFVMSAGLIPAGPVGPGRTVETVGRGRTVGPVGPAGTVRR